MFSIAPSLPGRSTAPVFSVVGVILLMFHFGTLAGVSQDTKAGGLYGTMGMLSTVACAIFKPLRD